MYMDLHMYRFNVHVYTFMYFLCTYICVNAYQHIFLYVHVYGGTQGVLALEPMVRPELDAVRSCAWHAYKHSY